MGQSIGFTKSNAGIKCMCKTESLSSGENQFGVKMTKKRRRRNTKVKVSNFRKPYKLIFSRLLQVERKSVQCTRFSRQTRDIWRQIVGPQTESVYFSNAPFEQNISLDKNWILRESQFLWPSNNCSSSHPVGEFVRIA